AASRSSSFVWRFTTYSVTHERRKHKQGSHTSNSRPASIAYWQNARETNVSVRHSGPVERPAIQTLGGHTSAVVMSRLFPESKPFALHMILAAATQSGAPFGAS